MKVITVTAVLLVAGALPGFCQTPRRLSSIFNSKLAFYLPAPDSTPLSTSVVNTAGGTPTISQNTWLEVHGTNLAQTTDTWDKSDFSKGLPTTLDGVSATVNGKAAAVFYVSPTQINILAPLDTATGPVPVKVTTAFGSTTLSPTEQATSPGFLVIDAPNGHVAARHLPDFSLLGPTSLNQPGYVFTPAKPGETVALYATGFGQTNPAMTDQPVASAGQPLPTLPLVTIGGLPATVSFANVSGPGLYQFVVIVPTAAPDGDQVLLATYNGVSTQKSVVITVQH